ncbi:upf0704 protein c6orf165, partial [Cystoisospora suis]
SEHSQKQGDINTAAIAIVLVVLYRKIVNCPFTVLRDTAGVKKLYDKVLQYCFRRFLQAPWTSPDTADEEAVLSDTRAALESALPAASLKSIFSLPLIEKRRYIEELSHIVLGIRIFNTQSSRGGVCLPDPRNLIDFRRRELMHALEKKIKEGEKLTRELSEILLKPSDPVSRRGKESDIAVRSQPGTWKSDSHTVSGQQIYATQLMLYRRALLGAMVQSGKQLKTAISECVNELMELKQAVRDSKTLSRDFVFPRFSRLAAAYHRAFQEGRRLTSLENLVHSLEDLATKCKAASDGTAELPDSRPRVESYPPDCKDLDLAASVAATPVEAGNQSVVGEEKLSDDGPVPALLDEEACRQARCCLELAGNCLYHLAKHGALVAAGDTTRKIVRRGNPRWVTAPPRVIAYDGRAYPFSTADAAEEFMRQPQDMIRQLRQRVKEQPALIHLLGLDHMFPRQVSIDGCKAIPQHGPRGLPVRSKSLQFVECLVIQAW